MSRCGLDVFEDEPKMKPGLAECENAVIVPHIASASLWTRAGMVCHAHHYLFTSSFKYCILLLQLHLFDCVPASATPAMSYRQLQPESMLHCELFSCRAAFPCLVANKLQ